MDNSLSKILPSKIKNFQTSLTSIYKESVFSDEFDYNKNEVDENIENNMSLNISSNSHHIQKIRYMKDMQDKEGIVYKNQFLNEVNRKDAEKIIDGNAANQILELEGNFQNLIIDNSNHDYKTIDNDKNNNILNIYNISLLNNSNSDSTFDLNKEILNSITGHVNLPSKILYIKHLEINKSITIKGSSGSCVIIEEGPIIVNLSSSHEVVKFSQVDFIFQPKTDMYLNQYNKKHLSEALIYYMFKLYNGSQLEIEMCNITTNRCKFIPQKIICFQIMTTSIGNNPKQENLNLEKKEKEKEKSILIKSNINIVNKQIIPKTTNGVLLSKSNTTFQQQQPMRSISFLKIISSKISKFDQTIRASDNMIIEIENSFIENNINKAIVLLNPIILKIINTSFEMNLNSSIHIKYIKPRFNHTDPNSNETNFSSSKIFFEELSFHKNYGSGIQIEGNDEMENDVEIIINRCSFRKNKGNSLVVNDLIVNKLRIESSLFQNNGENGIFLQNINFGRRSQIKNEKNEKINSQQEKGVINSEILEKSIVIRKNKLIDNDLCGIFVNKCLVVISENSFIKNKNGGLVLTDLTMNKEKDKKEISKIEVENEDRKDEICIIQKNDFIKNGGCGLKISNFQYYIYISSCLFQENIEYGVYISNITPIQNQRILNFNTNHHILSSSNIIYKSFSSTSTKQHQNLKQITESNQNHNENQNIHHNKFTYYCNVYMCNSKIIFNLKSGIFLQNLLLFIANTNIYDNIHYAIEVSKEEYRRLFILDKYSEKNITGTLGGEWGEVSLTNKFNCVTCTFNFGNKEKERKSKLKKYSSDIDFDIQKEKENENKFDDQVKVIGNEKNEKGEVKKNKSMEINSKSICVTF